MLEYANTPKRKYAYQGEKTINHAPICQDQAAIRQVSGMQKHETSTNTLYLVKKIRWFPHLLPRSEILPQPVIYLESYNYKWLWQHGSKITKKIYVRRAADVR